MESISLPHEVLDEALTFRIIEHALHLTCQLCRLGQATGFSDSEKRIVRHTPPQKIGQARGQTVFIQDAAFSVLVEK